MTSATRRRQKIETNHEHIATERAPARRRRPLQLHLRNGIEAALRADPKKLDETDPRTCMGRVARSLVQKAGEGETPALKLMLSMIEWKDPEGDTEEAATVEARNDEPKWDWNESGDWDFAPREGDDANGAKDGAPRRLLPTEEEDNYFKNELRRRFARLNETDALEAARKAKLNGSSALGSTAHGWAETSAGSDPSTGSG